MAEPFSPWPHQTAAVDGVKDRRFPGHTLVVVIPTGGGKTWCVGRLAREEVDAGGRVVVYTNRRALIDQLGDAMDRANILFGVRAAGHRDERHLPVQVSSIQTENERSIKTEGQYGGWELHNATLVFIDEAHSNTGPVARKIMAKHREAGAYLVGMSATPTGLGGVYDEMFVAARNSDLRKCKSIVPAHHFAVDEPDLRDVGRVKVGEDLTEPQNVKAIMRHGVAGRVYGAWRFYNPDARPAILFAPGVAESRWFVQKFWKAGVKAAHVDGGMVLWNGREYLAGEADPARKEIMQASKEGDLPILSNRFVLREGVDMPWLYHAILATVFGSVTSYLQAVGRLLRYHPSTPRVVVTDHGGNWWRHGSVNADREWWLGCTTEVLARLQIDHLGHVHDQDPQPVETRCAVCGSVVPPRRYCPVCEARRCPECNQVTTRRMCECGYEYRGYASRRVVTTGGQIVEVEGPVVRPKHRQKRDNTVHQWVKCYWQAFNSKKGKTFRQAEAYFYRQHGYYPPRTLTKMPRRAVDWYALVKHVPGNMLY